MADEADRANELAQIAVDHAVQRIKNKQFTYKDSADECIECGNLIPSARQLAIPGVQLCIECQRWAERKFAEFGIE